MGKARIAVGLFAGIHTHGAIPAFLQIEIRVQDAIAAGRLRSGDWLPAVQSVSEYLGINSNTVSRAYHHLQAMDLIRHHRGNGYRAKGGAEARCRRRWSNSLVERIQGLVAEAREVGMGEREVAKVVRRGYAIASGSSQVTAGSTPDGRT
jgi:DNA-binding transcriptional regulator YhcF (GntR family)